MYEGSVSMNKIYQKIQTVRQIVLEFSGNNTDEVIVWVLQELELNFQTPDINIWDVSLKLTL